MPQKRGLFMRLIDWLFEHGFLGEDNGFRASAPLPDRTARRAGGRVRPEMRVRRSESIVVEGPDGSRREYNSLAEAPREVRELLGMAHADLLRPAAAQPAPPARPGATLPAGESLLSGDPDEVIDLVAAGAMDDLLAAPPIPMQRGADPASRGGRSFSFAVSSSARIDTAVDRAGRMTSRRFIYKSPDGTERAYQSLEEMSPAVREVFERIAGWPGESEDERDL